MIPAEVDVRATGVQLSVLTAAGESVTVSALRGTWKSGAFHLQDVVRAEGVSGKRGEVVLVRPTAESMSVYWEAADDGQP